MAIDLAGAELIGRGCRRVVYVDPRDPARCIKVPTAEARAQLHRQKALQRELHYLAFYERKHRSLEQLSRYFGPVETTEGEGYVFELIRNQDGSVARTLQDDLDQGLTPAQCRDELEELRHYLASEGIIVADLHAANLARQQVAPGVFRLVVIDGIGNTEFVKVHDHLRFLARRKANRKWDRFLSKLKQ